MCVGSRVYSLKEVSAHCTPEDCWVIVDGHVYDVSDYVSRHPGGAMIHVKAGGDCSQLFDAYHIKAHVRKVLDKYEIGTIERTTLTTYEQQGVSDKFYVELKDEVNKYFKVNNLHPRFSTSMYVKTALILILVAGSAVIAFFGAASYVVSLVAAALLGFGMAEVGVSVQHDANHGAFCRNRVLCYIAGLTLDAVGASSFMWKQQHVVGHHAYTNVIGVDPDIRVSPDGADARRVVPQHPKGVQHAWQHVYLAALYALLAVKSIFVDDFNALSSRSIGSVRVPDFTAVESACFWAGKALFAAWFIAAPVVWSPWSLPALMGLWAVALAICGWTLAFMFQVAHVSDDVAFLEQDANGVVAGSWAAQQIATCADFAHNSWFWTHVSGGLNYQAVHHLFPGVLHTHYPGIAPIVLRAAEKWGVPYKVYPTFWSALASHFRHLRKAGLSAAVPSLQTVG